MSMCDVGRQRGAAFAIWRLGAGLYEEEGARERAGGQGGAQAAQKLSVGEESKYCWKMGKNLGQELLHRRECGREAHLGALNFRDSERRAQSRLFSQQKLSNPSRFYKEAARHPEGDIIDSMALALRKKVVLLDCNMIGVQKQR